MPVRRLVLAVALLVCATLALGGSVAAPLATGLSWQVRGAPFELRVMSGATLVTDVGGPSSPLTYATASGATHRIIALAGTRHAGAATSYALATDEPGRNATLTVARHGEAVRLDFSVARPSTVAAVGIDFSASTRTHFLGTGERLRWVDMRGTVVPLKVRNQCGSNAPSPFFVSSSGFGAWSSSTAVGRVGFPGRVDDSNFACDLGSPTCSVGPPVAAVRFCFKSAEASFDVAAGSPASLLSRHARSVGLPRAPWLPQLALMKWRDAVSGPSELIDDIQQLRTRGIPVGWVILDNPWESGAFQSGCYGSLSFDPHVFPDPAGTISAVHALGVRFMLWISPQLARKSCSAPGYPDGWLSGDDETFVRDLTNAPEAADFQRRLQALVALGVDGFKGDRGDEVNLEPDTLVGGSGTKLQNLYPLLFARAAAAALRSAHGGDYATLFRSFVPGSSTVLPGLAGPDEPQTWDGLVDSIRAAQTSGIAGDPVWGTDIGGYQGGTLTADVFVRWAQFAALTPIFEVGGSGPSATFWQLGRGAVDGFKAAAGLHYELAPYLYELALEASRNGIPVVRPLGLGWPADAQAWAHDLEFTVGDALLAAPLTDDHAAQKVYLPAGTWADVFTGHRYAGGHTITRVSGATDFPLYVRAGTALADNFRTPSLWPQPWRADELVRNDRQGWLVATRPGATATARDRGTVLVATTSARGDVSVRITRGRAQQQLRILSASRICSAGAAGRQVPLVASPGGVVLAVDGAPSTLTLALHAC